MPKFLIRIASMILIPCILAGDLCAAPPDSHPKAYGIPCIFETEALMLDVINVTTPQFHNDKVWTDNVLGHSAQIASEQADRERLHILRDIRVLQQRDKRRELDHIGSVRLINLYQDLEALSARFGRRRTPERDRWLGITTSPSGSYELPELFRNADRRNTTVWMPGNQTPQDLGLSKDQVLQFEQKGKPAMHHSLSSYKFNAGPNRAAYRVAEGERIWISVPEGEEGFLASTNFSCCAGVAIQGRDRQGRLVLYLAHILAEHPKGQAAALREDIDLLRAAGVTDMKLYASIDPAAYALDGGHQGDWEPAFYTFPRDLQSYLGPDVTVLDVIPALHEQGAIYERHMYVTTQGVVLEYAHHPTAKEPILLPWTAKASGGITPARAFSTTTNGLLAKQA